MSRRSRFPITFSPIDPFAMWAKLATQSADMLLASGEVIAHRNQLKARG
ncbi:MAG TPA: hypothetical protein VGC19_15090 [Rhodanobacter sp.]